MNRRHFLLIVVGILLALPVLYVASFPPIQVYFVSRLGYCRDDATKRAAAERQATAVKRFYSPLLLLCAKNKPFENFLGWYYSRYAAWEWKTFNRAPFEVS